MCVCPPARHPAVSAADPPPGALLAKGRSAILVSSCFRLSVCPDESLTGERLSKRVRFCDGPLSEARFQARRAAATPEPVSSARFLSYYCPSFSRLWSHVRLFFLLIVRTPHTPLARSCGSFVLTLPCLPVYVFICGRTAAWPGGEVRHLRAQGEGQGVPDADGHALREGAQLPLLRPAHEQAVVQGVLGARPHNPKVGSCTHVTRAGRRGLSPPQVLRFAGGGHICRRW